MATQLLAQALAVAYNPQASPEELREVIGDLLRLGAFDVAETVAERLFEDLAVFRARSGEQRRSSTDCVTVDRTSRTGSSPANRDRPR